MEFYIPENAPHQKTPQWEKDLQELILMDKEKGTQAISYLVEAAEKRIDARIYKEVKFALPKELTEEQCKILGRRFIQNNLADKGILSLGNYHDLETDKPLRTDSKPKLNHFKIERSTGNHFKVEKASVNPFDLRGMGVNKILLTIS